MEKMVKTPIKIGTLNDVRLGQHIVFEVTENGKTTKYTGLEYVIQIEPNIFVVDNHDRVLEFRPKGLPVIHIDQHSDMGSIDVPLHVGNFLRYALETGHIPSATQIRTEYSLLQFDREKKLLNESILDIDLDFRHPDMSIEHYDKTIQMTKSLISQAKIVTIATSPYFLDQALAIQILHDILPLCPK